MKGEFVGPIESFPDALGPSSALAIATVKYKTDKPAAEGLQNGAFQCLRKSESTLIDAGLSPPIETTHRMVFFFAGSLKLLRVPVGSLP
jgi:hypothetical protein